MKETCTLTLAIMAIMWTSTPVNAQRGRVEHVDVHPAPHVGSVHFATRPVEPVRVVPRGIVRDEHYEHPDYHGVYRNPYRDDYFRRFRPGYWPIVVDDAQYYVYSALPAGYQIVVVNGVTYYLLDGVYYLPYIYNGQTVFMVVPPPA